MVMISLAGRVLAQSAGISYGEGTFQTSNCNRHRIYRISIVQAWVAISEIVRNIGLFLAGVIGLYLAWRRVSAANRQADAQVRQAELSRRDHVSELFNRAVGQLKDEKLEVRLGAIYTLRQICFDFTDLSDPVIQLLTTYLRENPVNYGDAEPPIDVREIMRLLGDRLEDRK